MPIVEEGNSSSSEPVIAGLMFPALKVASVVWLPLESDATVGEGAISSSAVVGAQGEDGSDTAVVS